MKYIENNILRKIRQINLIFMWFDEAIYIKDKCFYNVVGIFSVIIVESLYSTLYAKE